VSPAGDGSVSGSGNISRIPGQSGPRRHGTQVAHLPASGELGAIVKLLDLAPWRMSPRWTAVGAGSPHDFRLSSHFQAIYSTTERRPVGYEALIRATRSDGLAIEPVKLLESVPEGALRSGLDRECRKLQVERFLRLGEARSRLFLNLDPCRVVEPRFGAFFAELLRAQDLPAERVAVELTETSGPCEEKLAWASELYRELGCAIVVDDFGAGQSNFERVWRLKPDIVKIDREMTRRLSSNAVARRMLAGIVAVLQDSGAAVCVEGIETEDQALCAIDAGADLLQGYYFSRPAETLVAPEAFRDVFDHLRDVSARRRHAGTPAATPQSISRRSRTLLRQARAGSNVIRFRRRVAAGDDAA
jgi:EAL domain-containing protein (putative c-di-GMP-specific phosphodiesterase class I)